MFNYIWPLAIIVLSNIVYQICAKGIPQQMNTFASMAVTYAVSTIFCIIAYFISAKDKNLIHEFGYANWATVILGIVITGLEVGFIFAYKAGWKVSSLATFSNAFLAVALLFVGALFYHEVVNIRKIFGVAICLVGLWFINK